MSPHLEAFAIAYVKARALRNPRNAWADPVIEAFCAGMAAGLGYSGDARDRFELRLIALAGCGNDPAGMLAAIPEWPTPNMREEVT